MNPSDTTAKRGHPINMAEHMRSVQDGISSIMGDQWISGAGEFGQYGNAMGQVASRILAHKLTHTHAIAGAMITGQIAAAYAVGEMTRRMAEMVQLNGKAMAEQIREMVGCRNMREFSTQQIEVLRTAGNCLEVASGELRDCSARVMLAALAPLSQALQAASADPEEDAAEPRQDTRARRAASER